MAHSAVWGHSPIQRQNTNSQILTNEKLSKSDLRRCTKFGQPHSNDERKIILSLILYFMWDFRISYRLRQQLKILIWPEKENWDLNEKSPRLKMFYSIISIILQIN